MPRVNWDYDLGPYETRQREESKMNEQEQVVQEPNEGGGTHTEGAPAEGTVNTPGEGTGALNAEGEPTEAEQAEPELLPEPDEA